MTEKLSDERLEELREDIAARATSYAHMLANGEKYDDGGLDVMDESIKYQQLANVLDELTAYRARPIPGNDGLTDEERKACADHYNATAGSTSLRLGELDKIEKAIALKRAEAAEDKLNRVRDALSNAPECDKYDDDDVIVCGWKRDMQSVRTILDGSDT